MIVTEQYGDDFIRTYSDSGFKIIQDNTGIEYDEAIDPISENRTYTESDILRDDTLEENSNNNDLGEILNILLGGSL